MTIQDELANKEYQQYVEMQEKWANVDIEEAVRSGGFTLWGYCSKCHRWHRHDSKIGRAHWSDCHIRGGRTN